MCPVFAQELQCFSALSKSAIDRVGMIHSMNLLMSFLLDLWCVLSNPIQSSFSCEMAKVCKAIFFTRDFAKLYVNSDTLFHKSLGHEQLTRSGHPIVTVVSASEFRALDQVINEHYFKLQVCAQASGGLRLILIPNEIRGIHSRKILPFVSALSIMQNATAGWHVHQGEGVHLVICPTEMGKKEEISSERYIHFH